MEKLILTRKETCKKLNISLTAFDVRIVRPEFNKFKTVDVCEYKRKGKLVTRPVICYIVNNEFIELMKGLFKWKNF